MNPLLIDLPEEFETDRLILRCPRSGDGKIIYPSVRESLAELKIWMPWATDEYSESSAEEFCRRAAANFITREQLQFVILSRADNSHLGSVGAFKFDWKVPKGEIGYWLRTSKCGQGLMSEAVNVLTGFLIGRLKFNRVEIRADDRNHKSHKVAERCEFILEGTLRKDSIGPDGSVQNTRIYSKIAGD